MHKATVRAGCYFLSGFSIQQGLPFLTVKIRIFLEELICQFTGKCWKVSAELATRARSHGPLGIPHASRVWMPPEGGSTARTGPTAEISASFLSSRTTLWSGEEELKSKMLRAAEYLWLLQKWDFTACACIFFPPYFFNARVLQALNSSCPITEHPQRRQWEQKSRKSNKRKSPNLNPGNSGLARNTNKGSNCYNMQAWNQSLKKHRNWEETKNHSTLKQNNKKKYPISD